MLVCLCVLHCVLPLGFLPWEIRVAFPGESHLQQSRATQPTVQAGYSSVSILHRILTWTTRSLTCSQMVMHATAHGGARTHVRESALKVDSERNISCRTGESNLRQTACRSDTLNQLSYIIPAPIISFIYPDRFSITTEYQKGLYKRSGANNKTVQVLERLCVLSVISEAVLTTKQSKC